MIKIKRLLPVPDSSAGCNISRGHENNRKTNIIRTDLHKRTTKTAQGSRRPRARANYRLRRRQAAKCGRTARLGSSGDGGEGSERALGVTAADVKCVVNARNGDGRSGPSLRERATGGARAQLTKGMTWTRPPPPGRFVDNVRRTICCFTDYKKI